MAPMSSQWLQRVPSLQRGKGGAGAEGALTETESVRGAMGRGAGGNEAGSYIPYLPASSYDDT